MATGRTVITKRAENDIHAIQLCSGGERERERERQIQRNKREEEKKRERGRRMNGCSRQERLQGPHGRSSRVVGSMSYRIGLDIV